MCQASCPVYREDRREDSVARGKVRLAAQLLCGDLPPTQEMARRLASCTSCGRCTAECPAGVRADAIVMAARAELVRRMGAPWWVRAMSGGLKARRLFGLGMRLGALSQRLALREVAGRPDLRQSRWPVGLGARRAVAPLADAPLHAKVATTDSPATAAGRRVLFFPGCLVTYVYPQIGEAVVRLLAAAGIKAVVPAEQQCCGLPALMHGDVEAARAIAREQVERLQAERYDAVVTACATCGVSLRRNYAGLLADDEGLEPAAAVLARRTRDVSEVLAERMASRATGIGPEGFGSGRLRRPAGVAEQAERDRPLRLTYHDPCHLVRSQGVAAQPRTLLDQVPGVELVEMGDPAACCGGAGSFSLTHPDLSLAIGRRKAADILGTGADLVVTGCPGCRLQLVDSLHRLGSSVPVVHIVELLDGGCGAGRALSDARPAAETGV